MSTITDPYDLKPGEVYRQARTVASKTSRGTDGNWYREPGDIACQWHIWFDGGREVCSATFSRSDNCWRQGPPLPLAGLTTGEDVFSLLGDLLSPTYFGHKPKALGVILHVADEFSLTEVSTASDGVSDGGDDFNLLRYNLIDSPKDFLADRDVSTDTVSWRLLPFWGAPTGQPRSIAVAMPRSRETFLSRLVEGGEDWRIPIRVSVASAPMEALAALALLKPEIRGGGLVAFPYLKYTAVFALNADGDLRSARSLAHRGGNPIPSSFGDILWNMAVSAELIANDGAGQLLPNLIIASPNKGTLAEATRELEVYSLKRQRIVAQVLDLSTHPTTASLPGNRPEFLPYDSGASSQVGSAGPLSRSETFRSLWDGWATQNFFNTAKIDNLYPTLGDLRLLRFSSWFVALLGLTLLALGGYGVYGLFTAMRHPSWELTEAQVQTTKTQHEKLFAEQKQIDITESLMKPRSLGWTNLELLLQMFPEDSGVRLDGFEYAVKPLQSIGAKKPTGPAAPGGIQTVGMTREWSFKGLAKAKTLDILNDLNSQRGLNAFFDQVAKATNDASLVPDPTRQVRLTLTQNQNPRFNVTASAGEAAKDPALTYPYSFEAVISQTITERDPLALPTGKPF
ncbi:hypothetical protein DES53_11787 [Roseimicrobium gellanilyticum]|uniref:Uncharacterized protein n=1 Tax=Roseimicrobium gellanilyticum TaxID=748857 RepID=A0A366H468_9BACT|nr:hypothetical protein [Roseimicrobium gellanilyticum]RBP36376.1 hypothetical protein DES53_11787 [Roseimicrobium gellanilyticum]